MRFQAVDEVTTTGALCPRRLAAHPVVQFGQLRCVAVQLQIPNRPTIFSPAFS
jgi:hypothetical protein